MNLSNGNLVWHSVPVVNPGRGLSTVANLTYNSQQRIQLPLLETPLEQLFAPYNEVGQGFSMGISSLTRLNERMNVDLASLGRITLTDSDGTRHVFKSSDGGQSFVPPKGMQLHLRRFSASTGLISAPLLGFEQLANPKKAWAATRPDGTTYYFDQFGYQQSSRTATATRSPTSTSCAVRSRVSARRSEIRA